MTDFIFKLRRKIFLMLLLAASPCFAAADDVTAKASKLYEKHYYEEAGRLLRPQLPAMNGANQAAARLTLGMIYLRSAELYLELQKTGLGIEIDYLKKLSSQKSANASHYADFFLGLALLEQGKYGDAVKRLQSFKSGADNTYQAYASVAQGEAFWRQKQTQKASALWDAVAANPEHKAALAAAYAASGIQDKHPAAMADAVIADTKKQKLSQRMLINLLRAYSYGEAPEKALDLQAANEFSAASYVESLGKSKSISFYDPGLLGGIAHAQLSAAVQQLELASRDSKLSNTAAYFLTDAYLLLGNTEQSLRHAATFLAQQQVPPQYRDHSRARQAAAQYLSGKRNEANVIWTELAGQSAARPDQLGEVMLSCAMAQADCAKHEKRAVVATEAGEGKKYFFLNAALGKYYLSRKDYTKAALYLEAGRDKANKNKIEINDPAMLTDLAEAYYRNKKYSESLEIYFEISKQYPAVRQIQEAMQGVYATEQKSAGDVKIF